jgi:hypothetical protein
MGNRINLITHTTDKNKKGGTTLNLWEKMTLRCYMQYEQRNVLHTPKVNIAIT